MTRSAEVGVSGVGRKSIARIAAHMADFQCFSIEITRTYGESLSHVEGSLTIESRISMGPLPTSEIVAADEVACAVVLGASRSILTARTLDFRSHPVLCN